MRGEKLERSFAHLLETGGLRRVHVRGHEDIRKRLLIHAAAFNLGLLIRRRCGVGTPRGLQGRPPQRKLCSTPVRHPLATPLLPRFCPVFGPPRPRSGRPEAIDGQFGPENAQSRPRRPVRRPTPTNLDPSPANPFIHGLLEAEGEEGAVLFAVVKSFEGSSCPKM